MNSFPIFALMAKQAQEAERIATSFALQRQALLKEHAENELVIAATWRLAESEKIASDLADRLKADLRRWCDSPEMLAFIDSTPGLGDAVFFFLGLLPKWVAEFETVSKLWAYCGLHVVEGCAPRRMKGQRANWSPILKAFAIKRLAEPCVRMPGRTYTVSKGKREGQVVTIPRSPYRDPYDLRRPVTAVTHPDWTDAHSHADAMRVTAKTILRDLWRVSRGLPPVGAVPMSAPLHIPPLPAGARDQQFPDTHAECEAGPGGGGRVHADTHEGRASADREAHAIADAHTTGGDPVGGGHASSDLQTSDASADREAHFAVVTHDANGDPAAEAIIVPASDHEAPPSAGSAGHQAAPTKVSRARRAEANVSLAPDLTVPPSARAAKRCSTPVCGPRPSAAEATP